MGRQPAERAIDLSRLELDGDIEVVEEVGGGPPPPRPPLRLFAGLDEPREVPYTRHADDRIGSSQLWRAISSL